MERSGKKKWVTSPTASSLWANHCSMKTWPSVLASPVWSRHHGPTGAILRLTYLLLSSIHLSLQTNPLVIIQLWCLTCKRKHTSLRVDSCLFKLHNSSFWALDRCFMMHIAFSQCEPDDELFKQNPQFTNVDINIPQFVDLEHAIIMVLPMLKGTQGALQMWYHWQSIQILGVWTVRSNVDIRALMTSLVDEQTSAKPVEVAKPMEGEKLLLLWVLLLMFC